MKPEALKLEEVLENELKGEMKLALSKPFNAVEWEEALVTVNSTPISYVEFTKRTSDLVLIKEVVDLISKGGFDGVARSEGRRKQMKEYSKTRQMYFNLIFKEGKKRTGYGALIAFSKLDKKSPDRSDGVILFSRLVVDDRGKQELTFERAAFDDFLLGVRPHIELLGDLYEKTRKEM